MTASLLQKSKKPLQRSPPPSIKVDHSIVTTTLIELSLVASPMANSDNPLVSMSMPGLSIGGADESTTSTHFIVSD